MPMFCLFLQPHVTMRGHRLCFPRHSWYNGPMHSDSRPGPGQTVEWTDDLSVGVTEIDNQHKELFRRRNDLIAAIASGRGRDELLRLTAFLETYIVTHFGLEEHYMTRFCYPGGTAHRKEHLEFMREFFEIKGKVAGMGPTDELVGRTGDFIIRWLRDHITIVDREFGQFLREKLKSSELSDDNVCISSLPAVRRYAGRPDERDLLIIEDGILMPGMHEVALNAGQRTAWLGIPGDASCSIRQTAGEGTFSIILQDRHSVEPDARRTVNSPPSPFRILAGGNGQHFVIIVT